MADIEIQITGAKELAQKFALLSDAVATTTLRQATTAGALLVENYAKQAAPVRTGNLRRSIHTEVIESTRSLANIAVGTNVEYARAVEFGTMPHVIRPVNKKALFWKGAAHPVRKVMHPGTKPRPFLIPALRDHLEEVKAEFVNALRDLLGQT